MARIEWVRLRLENWSRWCTQQDGNGLGYPSMSAFARLGGKGSRGEAVIPIIDIDASEIDQAVKSLHGTQSALYLVLMLTYAKGLDRRRVAKAMSCDERTVRNNLDRADVAIARWLEDRRAMRENAKQRSQALVATSHLN